LPAMNDDAVQLTAHKKAPFRALFFRPASAYLTVTVPFIIEMWPGNEQKNA